MHLIPLDVAVNLCCDADIGVSENPRYDLQLCTFLKGIGGKEVPELVGGIPSPPLHVRSADSLGALEPFLAGLASIVKHKASVSIK